MDWITSWMQRRRDCLPPQPIRRSRRKIPKRRPFEVETLESRALLAGDTIPVVSFRLEAADPVTLHPITAIQAGDEFALVAYVRDLRSQPQGVFSAYLDVNFPAAQFEVSGPIRHLGSFTNGTSGAVNLGIVDEVGGFSADTQPPGAAEQMLVAIPFIARQAGEFTFTADAAELTIGHEVLLFGSNDVVRSGSLQFQGITTHVTPSSGSVAHLNAIDDEFFVRPTSSLTLDVLANDSAPAPTSMTVFRVDNMGTAGLATVSADHRHIQYSPPANFSGVDLFHYSVVDNRADSDTAEVTVHVDNGTVTDKNALFRVVTTDHTGRLVSAVNQGDDFLLQVLVADTRPNPQGVFAAYVDIAFPPQIARATGPLEFAGTFTNGVSGDRLIAGLIDEAGAFTSRLSPTGDGESLLFQVPMKATNTGKAIFQSGPADIVPDHQSLLFGDNLPLDPARIGYGQAELLVRPAVIVVDDSFDVAAGSAPSVMDVLANDQATSTSQLTITQVDTTDLRGTVSVATDGRSLTFAPAANSRGTEQFRYTAANASGNATAQVTVHLQPLATLDDLMQIRLATTNLAGSPTTSVNAGEMFNVQAWVRDLRAGDAALRGVYAAYLDLLYDADRALIVPETNNPRGVDITFGPQFHNGLAGNGAVPGIIDEVGAFQTAESPPGTGEQLLFTAKFQANTGRAAADNVTTKEDAAAEFDVLSNDQSNQGSIKFRTDPADVSPESDVLLFDPVQPVAPGGIRFLSSTINVVGGSFHIVDVSASRRGGKVTIVGDGHAVRYEPPSNYFGPDEFTYSLGPGSDTVVHVNVVPVNDAPTALPDRYLAGHHQPLTVTAGTGVLANDADVDRDALQTQLVSPTPHGQLQLNSNGSFTYTPNDDFFGTDTFVYRSFDGSLSSGDTTVDIEVAPPAIRIRLEADGSLGQPVTEIRAGEPLVLRAFVQDMRDATRTDRGVGAVYFDLNFDPATAQPRADSTNPLGFDIAFGEKYQNVRTGNIRTPGMVDDVGALQTAFTPTGRDELQLFSMSFQSLAPRVADDSYRVSKHSNINVFDLLANENGQAFPLEFRAVESGNSPHADVVLFEPAQAIHGEGIAFGHTVVNVRNSSKLVLDSLGGTSAGGTVSIDPLGRGVRYTPPQEFVGTDSFTYTVRDEFGQRRTGTVTVQVVDSWSNELLQLDPNSDSFITPNDVLQIINDLNLHGGRRLPVGHLGSTFFDVNRDGHATAIDALILINFLSKSLNGESEGEGVAPDFDFGSSPNAEDNDGLVVLIARDRLESELSRGLSGPVSNQSARPAQRLAATDPRQFLPAVTMPDTPQTVRARRDDPIHHGGRAHLADASLLNGLFDDEELQSLAATIAPLR